MIEKARSKAENLPISHVSMRDLYGELREMGFSSDNYDKIIEWSETF